MAEFVIDGAAVAAMMRDPGGPVGRKMIVIGEAVRVRTVASLKDGFVREWLGPRVVKRFVTNGDGVGVQVGSDKVKTNEHRIPLEGNGPPLAFDWPKAGGLVFFANVKHPGSDFSNYLQKQLAAAVDSIKGTI